VLRNAVKRAWRLLGANCAAPVNQSLSNVAVLGSRRLAQVHLHVAARNKPQATNVLREHADCENRLKNLAANRHAKGLNPFARNRVARRIQVRSKLGVWHIARTHNASAVPHDVRRVARAWVNPGNGFSGKRHARTIASMSSRASFTALSGVAVFLGRVSA
jgi:hypothetical protein